MSNTKIRCLKATPLLNECDEYWQVEIHYLEDGRVLTVKCPFQAKYDFYLGITNVPIEWEVIDQREMTLKEKREFNLHYD
ncbi:hypothetical protein H6G33_10035 [Calothrix sp. FACHB-1219]|uniref:hypothetical protein n=1 Tax=unclassified Calothrix TaxID=2619626 RepID=UPI001685B1ED|nr:MULTISPECIES: hypothetical protein [unclassified Calothrix]MBD2201686.1 hypothetical protein [Calothrix sp. FACHB-168]MBD2217372.1 hypothetical protein [Calothrix sp. FACHB-1219]